MAGNVNSVAAVPMPRNNAHHQFLGAVQPVWSLWIFMVDSEEIRVNPCNRI